MNYKLIRVLLHNYDSSKKHQAKNKNKQLGCTGKLCITENKKKKKEIKLLFNLKNKRVTMDTNVVYRSNVLDGTSFSGIMISDDR